MDTTPNPFRGEAEILLDKPRKLKINLNMIAIAERRCACNLCDLNPFNVGISGIRAWIYAGLLHYDDATITPDKVGEWMEKAMVERRWDAIAKSILESMKAAFSPEPEEGDPKNA